MKKIWKNSDSWGREKLLEVFLIVILILDKELSYKSFYDGGDGWGACPLLDPLIGSRIESFISHLNWH